MNTERRRPLILRSAAALTRRLRRVRYQLGGRLPWSVGYTDVKYQLLASVLADDEQLARIGSLSPLPAGYGVGLDERVVEYPWVFVRLRKGPGRLLDAGSTLNNPVFLDHPRISAKQVTITTFAPEPYCFWWRGVSYDFEDLRDLPYRDATFDEVVCISTLEHVGMDNTMWGGPTGGDDFMGAAKEFVRVLRPGGRLLITVPFGRAMKMGFQRQFDEATLEQLAASLAPCRVRTTFFRYTLGGWTASDLASCRSAVYFNVHERGYGGRGPIRYDRDHAAAARAVACLDATKPGPRTD